MLQNLPVDNHDLNIPDADLTDSAGKVLPYIIFKIYNNLYALNCEYVESIQPLPPITTEVSQISPETRGVTYYKDKAINLIDMRKLFGIINQEEYITTVVDIPARRQAHISFVEKIEAELANENPMPIPDIDNPHMCSLGKWLDNYVPMSSQTQTELNRLGELHELFHIMAKKTNEALTAKKIEEALQLFELAKSECSLHIIEKLDSLEKLVLSEPKEFFIIIKVGDKTAGLIVDGAESVEHIDYIHELPQSVIVSKYIRNYGLRNKDDSILLILEASAFE